MKSKIMKKTYQKPEIFIEKIELNHTILNNLSLNATTKAVKDGEVLTKDRGDYEPENEPTFGDLW